MNQQAINTDNTMSLRTPWGPPVRRGWLKALIAIGVYFFVRFVAELRLVTNGLIREDIQVELNNPITSEQLIQAMTSNQWALFIKEVLLVVLVLALLYFLKLRLFARKEPWTKGRIKRIFKYFGMMMLGSIVLNGLLMIIAPDRQDPANEALVQGLFGSLNVVVSFFMVVIAAPVVEEILMRGLIMRYVFRPYPVIGALAGSVFFTLLHSPSNWMDFLTYYILSLSLTLLYWRTRRIEDAIALHMLNNFVSFVVSMLAIYFVQ